MIDNPVSPSQVEVYRSLLPRKKTRQRRGCGFFPSKSLRNLHRNLQVSVNLWVWKAFPDENSKERLGCDIMRFLKKMKKKMNKKITFFRIDVACKQKMDNIQFLERCDKFYCRPSRQLKFMTVSFRPWSEREKEREKPCGLSCWVLLGIQGSRQKSC